MATNTLHPIYSLYLLIGQNGGPEAAGRQKLLDLGIKGLTAERLETIVAGRGKRSNFQAIYDEDMATLEAEGGMGDISINDFLRGNR